MTLPSVLAFPARPQTPRRPGDLQGSTPILLTLLALAGPVLEWSEGLEIANAFVPVALIALCAGAMMSMLKRDPVMVASPLPWFFFACAFYYGLGALAQVWGSARTITHINAFYNVDEWMLLRTHQLNVVSILVVCVAYRAGLALFPLRPSGAEPIFDEARLDRFIMFCLIVGGVMRYLIVRIAGVHWLPSFIDSLGNLTFVALILMTASVFNGRRKWLRLWLLLMGWELFLALIVFGKLDALFLFINVFIGYFLVRPRLRWLVAALVLGIALYWVLTPMTTYGRQQLRGEVVTVSKQVRAVLSYWSHFNKVEGEHGQSWWSRLCYSNAQAFCLDSYDRGQPGETFSVAAYALVPRFLYPSKPNITLGPAFTEAVTGRADNNTSPGFFAEAYWNGGWLWVTGACAYAGLLFVWLAHILKRCFNDRDFRWMPVVVQGFFIGLRPDGWFAATFVNSIPIALSQVLLLYLIFKSPARGQPA